MAYGSEKRLSSPQGCFRGWSGTSTQKGLTILISDNDSIKQDIGIVVVGLLAALFFFWFYSDIHPLGAADNSYGEGAAAQKSTEILQNFGYHSPREPVTRYTVNSSLLDSLQKQTDFHEFYSDNENRNLFPSFHWSSLFYMEPMEREGSINIGEEQAKTVEIQLSEDGNLLSLQNPHDILPSKTLEPHAFSFLSGDTLTPVLQIQTDTLLSQVLMFQFTGPGADDEGMARMDAGGRIILGEKAAQSIAEYYFEQTGWPKERFSLKQIEKRALDDLDAAQVVFEAHDPGLRQAVELTVTVLPTGTLLSLEYEHPSEASLGRVDYSDIVGGVRIFILLLGFFWVLTLLVIRFRLRLVDMKPAVLIAVLAGFIYPFIFVTTLLYTHLRSFGELDAAFLFMGLLFAGGVIAAFMSMLYFIITAIGDSITRQHWEKKLRSIDLIRTGHLLNKPVSLTFIRGISYSFIIAATWTLLLIVVPESYLSLEPHFRADMTYLANLNVLLGNFISYLILAQIIFLIVLGQLRAHIQSSILLAFISGVVFVFILPVFGNLGSLPTELLIVGITGMMIGWVYIREEFLTAFITLFFFGSTYATAGGWLLDSSPDAFIFYSTMTLVFAGFIFGCYGYYKGKSVRELPTFVPDYVTELAQEERIKGELQIARKVQEGLLPDRTPDIAGLDIAAICKPAYETGGDYYDFIRLDDGRLTVVIGDVSGKGIQAAFFMTFAKGMLHTLCNNFKSAIDLLVKMNKIFRRNANRGTFVSLIFGLIDVDNATFTFSRAGHNPLLYYNQVEKRLYEYKPQGLGLGLASEEIFRKNISEQAIGLNPGDIIILFTDGVVEATSERQTFYGDERLHRTIEKNVHLCAEDLLDKLMSDLQSFGENSDQHDDMTMVVIKKT